MQGVGCQNNFDKEEDFHDDFQKEDDLHVKQDFHEDDDFQKEEDFHEDDDFHMQDDLHVEQDFHMQDDFRKEGHSCDSHEFPKKCHNKPNCQSIYTIEENFKSSSSSEYQASILSCSSCVSISNPLQQQLFDEHTEKMRRVGIWILGIDETLSTSTDTSSDDMISCITLKSTDLEENMDTSNIPSVDKMSKCPGEQNSSKKRIKSKSKWPDEISSVGYCPKLQVKRKVYERSITSESYHRDSDDKDEFCGNPVRELVDFKSKQCSNKEHFKMQCKLDSESTDSVILLKEVYGGKRAKCTRMLNKYYSTSSSAGLDMETEALGSIQPSEREEGIWSSSKQSGKKWVLSDEEADNEASAAKSSNWSDKTSIGHEGL